MKKVTITIALLCVAALAQEKGTFTDSRDGKTYNTVKIGTQTWMAQNLNHKPEKGVARCYNDNEARCDKYGRFYDWETARKACPSGWHLPSNEEWSKLLRYVDGSSDTSSGSLYVGTTAPSLKAKNAGWADKTVNDKWNFSALPGGYGYSDGRFTGVGGVSRWWSATEFNDKNMAHYRVMGATQGVDKNWDNKINLFSVRCVQD